MPRALRLILAIVSPVILLVCFAIFGPRIAGADEASARRLRALVSRLSDPKSSDKAVPEIERLVNSEPQFRSALANGIRPIIYTGHSGSRPWKNAMRLAGDLKMVDLAQDIANFVDRPGSVFSGIESVSEEEPAGTALVKMGDRAIPALVHVAENGSRPQRGAAPMFIGWIGTPKAHQALESLLSETKDPEVKKVIEAVLHAFGQAPQELKGPPSSNGSGTEGMPAKEPPQGNGQSGRRLIQASWTVVSGRPLEEPAGP
jgi:HEAT repeat protein